MDETPPVLSFPTGEGTLFPLFPRERSEVRGISGFTQSLPPLPLSQRERIRRDQRPVEISPLIARGNGRASTYMISRGMARNSTYR
jgi:hypothetical protein